MNTMKCVVVGDRAVGKTCLLMSYAKAFPVEYVPTVFDNYAVNVNLRSQPVTLGLFDTAGQEDFGRLRVLSYTNTDVFLVCFSVMSPTAFENIKEKWVPEIAHYCPKTPFVLVGTQIDQRNNGHKVMTLVARSGQRPVIPAQGEELARELKAFIRSVLQEGLNEVFVEAIYAALHPPKKEKKRRCVVM